MNSQTNVTKSEIERHRRSVFKSIMGLYRSINKEKLTGQLSISSATYKRINIITGGNIYCSQVSKQLFGESESKGKEVEKNHHPDNETSFNSSENEKHVQLQHAKVQDQHSPVVVTTASSPAVAAVSSLSSSPSNEKAALKEEDSTSSSSSLRTRGFKRETREEKLSRLKRRKTMESEDEEEVGVSHGSAIPSVGRTTNSAVFNQNTSGYLKDTQRDLRSCHTYSAVAGAAASSTNQNGFRGYRLKFSRKRLKFGRSEIHNWGIFAAEPIAPQELIIEYVGELIRPILGDFREQKSKLSGTNSCSYMFRLDKDTIIDATRAGNLARYINHSCEPNSYSKLITTGPGRKRMGIYAKTHIEEGEEIKYDYKFAREDEKIPCYCGAPKCRGTMN